MKCRAWVIEKPGRKKGNGERAVVIQSVGDAYVREHTEGNGDAKKPKFWIVRSILQPTPPRPDATLCGGAIEATISAVDEPYYGGSSARLDITYVCKRCKHTYHGPDLPTTSEELSALVTQHIAGLLDDEIYQPGRPAFAPVAKDE